MATKVPRIDKMRSKRRLASGFKNLFFLVILISIAVVAMVSAFGVLERIAATNAEIAQVQAEIEGQLHVQQEIENAADYAQTREFIENVARNFLGLVYPDEIIFNMVE